MTGNVFAIGNTNADIVNIGGNADEINLGGAGTDLNLGTSGGQTDVAGNLNVIGNLRLTATNIKTTNGDNILTWSGNPASISIPGNLDTNGNLGVDGNSVIAGNLTVGNLTVLGSTTQTQVSNIIVSSKLITVSASAASAAQTDQSGLKVDTANATILYRNPADVWEFNKGIELGSGNLTTTGNISAGNISATNSLSANTLTGTISTASQTNITSLGTLTSLLVTGNIQSNTRLISGNLTSTGAITISSAANGNITLMPNGTGVVAFSGSTVVEPLFKNYRELVANLGNVSSSITPDFLTSVVKKYTLTGAIALNLPTNMPAGGSMTLILVQDATGARTMTPNGSYKFAAGSNILSTDPNAIDILNIFYDGTTYYCALSKGYV